MKANEKNNETTVIFSKEEIIVLLEWLHNFNEVDNSNVIQDQAEQRVLWDLEAELESVFSAPFDSNYNEILLQARQKIRDLK